MVAITVQLASNNLAKHQGSHRFRGFVAAGLVPFGRRKAIQPDRHGAELNRIAIANVGDLASQGARRAGAGRRVGREHQQRHENASGHLVTAH